MLPGDSGEAACECPGTSSPSSLAQATRTNSCRLGIWAFQPNRPARPSRVRPTRPRTSLGWLSAMATSTSEAMASIAPRPNSGGVFRSTRFRVNPLTVIGCADRPLIRASGAAC